jgi:hypothetical protein
MDYKQMYIYTGQLATAAMLIPLLMALFSWQQLNKALTVYFYYCLVTFLLDLSEATFVWSVKHNKDFFVPIFNAYHIKNTNFLRICFNIKNFIFVGLYFRTVLPRVWQKIWVWRVSLSLLFICLINYCFIQGINFAAGFNGVVDIIWSLILPLVAMWYEFNRDSLVPLKRNPYFWINLGLIIMGVLSLFFYLVTLKLQATDPNNLLAKLAIAKNGVYLLSLGFVTVGFYHARYTKYLPLK